MNDRGDAAIDIIGLAKCLGFIAENAELSDDEGELLLLKIITKDVFPVNDEEHITRIVELIQNNDLENKKENIRVRIASVESKEDKSRSKENSNINVMNDLN